MAEAAFPKTIIVTSADANYFGLLKGMIKSTLACMGEPACTIGCLDLGLTTDQKDWLSSVGVQVALPHTELRHGLTEGVQRAMGLLSRPYLPHSFPGFDIYVWLDADVWLQTWDAVAQLVDGARRRGAAFVREDAPEYALRPDLWAWKAINFRRAYGLATGAQVLLRPHINAGVFAIVADAPHWKQWETYYQRAIDHGGRVGGFDQFSLNAAVYLEKLPCRFLPATCNWICELAPPIWNEETELFVRPRDRRTPIDVMHLAGLAKTGSKNTRTTSGHWLIGGLRYDDDRVAADKQA